MRTLFDVGANKGKYAVEALKSGEFDRIICVEPCRSCLPFMQLLRAKFPQQIVALPLAVSDTCGDRLLFYEAAWSAISTAHPEWIASPRFHDSTYVKETYHVKTITLDAIIKAYGKPDMIKVDVECHEEAALKGLTQTVPLLCFEWAIENFDSIQRIVDRLQTLGFTQYHVQQGDAYAYRPSADAWAPIANFCRDDLVLADVELSWGMIWVRP